MPDVVGTAIVKVTTDTTAVRGGVTKAGQQAGKSFAGGFGGAIKGLLVAAGVTTIAAAGVRLIKSSIGEAREANRVAAITAQTIKTTGGLANVTAKEVADLSTALSRKAGVDDEVIQSGANMLLTFKEVRNEVGKGSDIFDRATAAALDLSAHGFGDMQTTSKQLGKALNDPIKGITALARSGVTFTQGQKDQIKALVETGHALEAQKIILKEVESQVGGTAEASANAGDKARVAWLGVQETIGKALLPAVDALANKFTNDVAPAIEQFFAEMQAGTGTGGKVADALAMIRDAGGMLLDLINVLSPSMWLWIAALGAAYGAVSRLGNGVLLASGKVTAMRTAMADSPTMLGKVGAAANAAGGFLRNLAGAGGLLLLIQGLRQTNEGLGLFETALGGVLTGFAVGGGPGAIIGGTAAAFFTLAQAERRSADAAVGSLGVYKDYLSTLDQLSGAITENTRREAKQHLVESKGLGVIQGYGFTTRQAITAITQTGPLRDRLISRLQDESAGYANARQAILDKNFVDERARVAALKRLDAHQRVIDALLEETGAVDKARDALTAANAENRVFTDRVNKLPKNVRIHLEEEGMGKTNAAIAELIAQFPKIDRKDIRLLIRENGGEPTKKLVDKLIRDAAALDAADPDVHVSTSNIPKSAGLLRTIINLANGLGAADPQVFVTVKATGALATLAAIKRAVYDIPRNWRTDYVVNQINRINRPTAPGGPNSARGSVVSTPTVGLYGEAGPEAIVPLTPGAPLNPGVLEAVTAFAQQRGIVGEGTGGNDIDINVTLPTGDPEAAAMAVLNRLVAVG